MKKQDIRIKLMKFLKTQDKRIIVPWMEDLIVDFSVYLIEKKQKELEISRLCRNQFERKYNELSAKEPVYTMLMGWFKFDVDYYYADCPCCNGIVIYNEGCENCKSDFIFQD